MSEEWGPWIEHDGKGCPVVGRYCQWVWDDGTLREGFPMTRQVMPDGRTIGRANLKGRSTWDWRSGFKRKTIRYRIRKPRGLTILEEVANGVREPVDA